MAGLVRFTFSLSTLTSLLTSTGDAQTSRRDSIEARKRVVRAQIAFEAVRRMHLPSSLQGSAVGCEVRVGRFCQWND
nr:hypothetical protein [Gemmatimonadota bacterium]